jgi:hypothetical protein
LVLNVQLHFTSHLKEFTMSRNTVLASVLLMGFGAVANAGVIVGGSTLLGSAEEAQLEAWLGEGPLTLTNIFTKSAGSAGNVFRSTVNGAGRTFVVMQATQDGSGATAIIGGYNPQSWNSNEGYNITLNDADRTAFIFNLTSLTKNSQQLGAGNCDGCGKYQTYNGSTHGPIFGGGFDLSVTDDLTKGYSSLWSYAPTPGALRTSLIDGSHDSGADNASHVQYGAMEVFTIAAAPPTDVPEPGSLALLGLGIGGISIYRRKRT